MLSKQETEVAPQDKNLLPSVLIFMNELSSIMYVT